MLRRLMTRCEYSPKHPQGNPHRLKLPLYTLEPAGLCGCGPSSWVGASGFRDFPGSPVMKENRNGNHRTLPFSHISYPPGESSMPTQSKDLKETESTLRSVIQSLIDGQEGFKKIGEQLKNETLKEYFLAESLTRAQFRGVLESILHQEGVHDIKEKGTATGKVRRAWGDLKSALGGGDHSLLATAEEA